MSIIKKLPSILSYPCAQNIPEHQNNYSCDLGFDLHHVFPFKSRSFCNARLYPWNGKGGNFYDRTCLWIYEFRSLSLQGLRPKVSELQIVIVTFYLTFTIIFKVICQNKSTFFSLGMKKSTVTPIVKFSAL